MFGKRPMRSSAVRGRKPAAIRRTTSIMQRSRIALRLALVVGLALAIPAAAPVSSHQAPPVLVPGVDKPVVVVTGEIRSADGRRPERRLGHANDSDPAIVDQLPEAAKRLIGSSVELYSRIQRLDQGQMIDEPAQSPARALMGRLERDLIWNRNA